MRSSKAPKESKRGRGRPEDRLVIDPAQAGEGLDRLLGKRPPVQAPRDEPKPRVRSKKPKAK